MQKNRAAQGTLDNPISKFWLDRRLKVSTSLITRRNGRLLDIGCGKGHFLSRIIQLCPRMKLYGIDISKENVDCARKNAPTAEVYFQDARKLCFKDSCFDYVSLLEIVEHFENPSIVINETRRVLKKNGELILSMPDGSRRRWKLLWFLWANSFGRKPPGYHLGKLDGDSLVKLLENNGFGVMLVKRILFSCIILVKARKNR